jgi:hypothetical protein
MKTWIAALFLAAASIAAAGPVTAHADEIVLGSTSLFRPERPNPPVADTDWINIAGSVCGISRVKFEVRQRAVRLDEVVFRFANGEQQGIDLGRQRFEAPFDSGWIDVPGATRCVTSMMVRGYTAPLNNPPGLGVVKFVGFTRPQFSDLTFVESTENAPFVSTLRVNEPALHSIQLRSRNRGVVVTSVSVRFANGETQQLDLTPYSADRRVIVRAGEPSVEMDLLGRSRNVETVTIVGDYLDQGRDGWVPAIEIWGRKRLW